MAESIHRLPELPIGIRLLTNEESDRLRVLNPGVPSSIRHCVTCDGAGTFQWYSQDRTEVVTYECPCEDQLVLHRYLLWCGVGTAYQRLGWSDGTAVEPGAVTAVRHWMDNSDPFVRSGVGLLLTGNKGSGKTLLSVLLVKAMLGEGVDGYFTTFSDLISMLMTGWHSDSAMRWYHAMCRNSSVLVIDDVGREVKQRRMVTGKGMMDFDTATSEFALESVLRHRIANAKPTILTTNLTVDQLTQHYGTHFRSLLTEAAKLYEFTGQDFRPQAISRVEDEAERRLVRPVVLG